VSTLGEKKVNATGRSIGARTGNRRTQIEGQFAPKTIEMLESAAFVVLSRSAHRILFRLEIELARHGGTDNGSLPVPYSDFQQYGIDRHAIPPAIREVVALGFVEITRHGRAGNAEYRQPHLFRITYRHTAQAGPTNEWKRIQTVEEAKAIAAAARKPVKRSAKRISSGGLRQFSVGESHTETASPIVAKPPLQSMVGNPPLLSISRVDRPAEPVSRGGTRRRGSA
jgi:hypothetical protein